MGIACGLGVVNLLGDMSINSEESGCGDKRNKLAQDIYEVLAKARMLGLVHRHAENYTSEPLFHWNALRDTRYAHVGHGLDCVLHIFQQQWVGIRAAAGSLPGHKLAVGTEESLDRVAKRELVRQIEQLAPQRVVVHGMSDALGDLVDALARKGWSERLFIVIHGAPAQWCSQNEARYAFRAFDLGRSRKIRRLHVMKPGFELPDVPLYKPMLLNLSPVISRENPNGEYWSASSTKTGVVLMPGWSGWRKNVHTNALAAALCDSVKYILVFDHSLVLPGSLNKKIRKMVFEDREQTFNLIQTVDAVMNVSIVDCHPMIHIEAQQFGKVCLRGPLFLDALEDHPYVKLTQVVDVTSIIEIRSTLDRVLSIPLLERRSLAYDYQCENDRVSIDRYREFLEL